MINYLIRMMSPEVIEQSFKSNPGVALEILQKFDTFKLLGDALTREQQVLLSNNTKYIKHYLMSEGGKSSVKTWAEGFVDFVEQAKEDAAQLVKNRQEEAEAEVAARTKILEDIRQKEVDKVTLALKEAENVKTRLALEISLRTEMETRIRKELEEKMRLNVADVISK